MLHLILLVLCWIFTVIAFTAGDIDKADYNPMRVLFVGMFIGTPLWAILEGIRWAFF